MSKLWKCWRFMVLKCWRFTKMLVLYWNVSPFMKMLAHIQNVFALWKCRRFIKILAFYEKVSGLWKCGCSMKTSVLYEYVSLYQNVGALWKSWRSTQHEKYTSTTQADHLTVWLRKIHSDCSSLLCLVVLVLSWRCCPLHLLLLSTSYRQPASLYGRTDPVLACHGNTGQMLAFYWKVGAQL